MTEEIKRTNTMGVEMATPLHLQRLERSLNVQPFLNQVQGLFNEQLSEDEDSSEDVSEVSDAEYNEQLSQKEEKKMSKLRLFNMTNVGEDRAWLQDILLSDDSDSSENSDSDASITEEDFQNMLRSHIIKKKYLAKFYQNPENIQYQYYGSGLLSNYDRFPEHQKRIVGNKKKKEKKPDKKIIKIKKEKTSHKMSMDSKEQGVPNDAWDRNTIQDEQADESDLYISIKHQGRGRGRKKHNVKSPEVMAMRRRKLWAMMAKKELGKVQRAKTNNHKEMLIGCKKVAQHCMKYWRQKAMQSQKNMKETVWRAKRLTREMQAYWKKCDRVERETRKRLEKEAEEQRKMDVEIIEAKRQQRKLNFLITQTELYAHFMSRKMGKASPEEQLRILNQLDEEKNPRLASIDDYDSELMKQKAKKNAMDAFDSEKARTRQFDPNTNQELRLSHTPETLEHPQPAIFKGNLKGYQLKGMNWLANLYDQGISGILADEMGLGKTVQSIAFLCHIAERYSVWGPFLIISPASTLHNWQQEMARFVPSFKVVPYWGNPQERKILRQFWDTKDLHTKEASFHVVITSYQLVITDYKYFNRIKWQYMILDEAQAIKSTNSMRWKLLLGFSCRNRLLLSGTPIQNSMAELWALLHFIMPTLFDSHDEFNEWFSKDIESHAENKTGIDEKHLSRLHMILKPFMLRRIKKDVENELSDKIEVMVYCPLTSRQKLLYKALKKKIKIEDLLHYSVGDSNIANDKNFTSNLMNLVMQFRKVCNHPELFERRDAKSPYFWRTEAYEMPVLLYKEGIISSALPSKDHLLYNKFFVFATEHIHKTLFSDKYEESNDSFFSFSRFSNLSPMELNRIFVAGVLFRMHHATKMTKILNKKSYTEDWSLDQSSVPSNIMWLLSEKLNFSSDVASDLLFTGKIQYREPVYTYTTHTIHSMPETMSHRILRSSRDANQSLRMQKSISSVKISQNEELKVQLLPEHPHTYRAPVVRPCQPTMMPTFLCDKIPKVVSSARKLYVNHSPAAHSWRQHEDCGGITGKRVLWLGSDLAENSPINPRVHYTRISTSTQFSSEKVGGLSACKPQNGWSNIIVPDKQTLVTDAGKLSVLDNLLKRLKEQGHRVLIYSQMTKMIDLLEEYMYHRKHTFMRLDGSSKISDRRDMVADFQKRADIFVFLLSTRAGGLGINLTAADTVIFYDSDWNPTVDQQAMDRAHRLGQTKQVTVYRLICKGTIEERILQRAREKSEIQRMVISGGNFKPDTLKPKEVVSLLLDDAEIEAKYSQRSEERKQAAEEARRAAQAEAKERAAERKRKLTALPVKGDVKKPHLFLSGDEINESLAQDSSNHQQRETDEFNTSVQSPKTEDETSNEGLVVDVDGPYSSDSLNLQQLNQQRPFGSLSSAGSSGSGSGNPLRVRETVRGSTKRGRPRGSRRGGPVGGKVRNSNFQMQMVHGSASASSTSTTAHHHASGEEASSSSFQASNQQLHPSPGQSGSGSANNSNASFKISASNVRRGPGRPRLRQNGPGHQGYRAVPLAAVTSPNIIVQHHQNSSTTSSPGQKRSATAAGLSAPMRLASAKQINSEHRSFDFYTQQQQQQQQVQQQTNSSAASGSGNS